PAQDMLRFIGYSRWESVEQVGADTLVRLSATDTILLQNVAASAVTTAWFNYEALPAISIMPVLTVPTPAPPPASPTPAQVISGGAHADTLTGDDGDDRILGEAGDDILDG